MVFVFFYVVDPALQAWIYQGRKSDCPRGKRNGTNDSSVRKVKVFSR